VGNLQISQTAIEFLARHNHDYDRAALLIYYSKQKGWWGIERHVQIKQQQSPFHNEDHLSFGKSEFFRYPIPEAPCPVYLDKEMETLMENAVIDMVKRGMYKFLDIRYTEC